MWSILIYKKKKFWIIPVPGLLVVYGIARDATDTDFAGYPVHPYIKYKISEYGSAGTFLTTVLNLPGLWIRIRIGSRFRDFVDPDPYWESGSRIRIQGQEN
jgi:hypothetical protein